MWSRIDNCHTNLVAINIKEKDIPAVAYQKILKKETETVLQYRHKSGKMYACTVCKSFKSPSELSIDFHVSKVKSNGQILPVHMWDMTCPKDILALEN